jgi:hypothetical protein
MFHLERGFHPEFIEAAVLMDERIRTLGASPFRDEKTTKNPVKKVPQKSAKKPAPKGGKKK